MDDTKINNLLLLTAVGALYIVVVLALLFKHDALHHYEDKKSIDHPKSFTWDRTTKIQRKLDKTIADLKIMHKMMGGNLKTLTEYMNTVREIYASVGAVDEAVQELNMLEITEYSNNSTISYIDEY